MRAGIEDVVFCFLRFPSGLAAHLHLSWLDPHKERRFTVVGSKRMATFDDMELERKVTVYDKGFDEDAALLRRVHHALGRHLVARGSRTTSRCGSSASTSSSCVRDGGDAALGRRQRAARRARARGAAALARRRARRRCRRMSERAPERRARRSSARACSSATACALGALRGDPRRARSSATAARSRTARCSASRRGSAPHSQRRRASRRRAARARAPASRSARGAIVFAGARDRRGRDRRRPGLRARARDDRRGIGDRARAARSTTTSRSARACGSRPTCYLTAGSRRRGRRVRRPGRGHHQRRHDGRATRRASPPRAARRCGARAASAAASCSCRASRSARRRSSPPARW